MQKQDRRAERPEALEVFVSDVMGPQLHPFGLGIHGRNTFPSIAQCLSLSIRRVLRKAGEGVRHVLLLLKNHRCGGDRATEEFKQAVRLKTLLESLGRCGKDGFKGEFGVGNSQHKVGKSKNKDNITMQLLTPILKITTNDGLH